MTNRSMTLATASLATLLALFAPTEVARADIFQWENINPANPSEGKKASTTLTPDGAGASAEPGSNLSNRNLTKAYLAGVNLSPYVAFDDYGYISGYARSILTSTTLSQADLSYASLAAATLTGANLSGADVRGTNFDRFDQYGYSDAYGYGTGLTLTQLASTASYAAHDLRGISLGLNNLAGANFSGFNLTNARFADANLTNVDFSNAKLMGGVISGTLMGINLSNAEVRGASLWGITKAQLYSTASYQANDLSGLLLYSEQTGWNFAGKNLSQAEFQVSMNLNDSNFSNATLTGARLSYVTLKNANISQANLTGALLNYASLTGADLTGAEVRGANFSHSPHYPGSGLSAAQLYSTASYQAHDLSGIGLGGNNLAGANLSGQNLTNAVFDTDLGYGADLSGANLSHANMTNARFGYSTLAGATLVQANLANVDLHLATLTNANFSHANLSGSDLGGYVVVISGGEEGGGGYYNVPGADLSGANLTGTNLTSANFSGTYGFFGSPSPGANLTSANLNGADARGANFQYATLTGANTNNLIQSDGHIASLDLTAGSSLVVRDYDGNPAATPRIGPLPIVVDQHLAMDATGTLRLEFDADPWDSTISFALGIPVTLGGTLDLTFASGVDVATQSGRTIDLFDWTGVSHTGAFTVESPYAWDLSKLYTTGEVTLAAIALLPGDFNGNGAVENADLTLLLNNWGKAVPPTPAGWISTPLTAPAVDNDELTALLNNWGATTGASSLSEAAIPEPASLALLAIGASQLVGRNSWRSGTGGTRGAHRPLTASLIPNWRRNTNSR